MAELLSASLQARARMQVQPRRVQLQGAYQRVLLLLPHAQGAVCPQQGAQREQLLLLLHAPNRDDAVLSKERVQYGQQDAPGQEAESLQRRGAHAQI